MSTYKGFTPSRQKANDKYFAQSVDSLSIYVPKGQKAVIKAAAERKGMSVNKFVVAAINAALKTDSENLEQLNDHQSE